MAARFSPQRGAGIARQERRLPKASVSCSVQLTASSRSPAAKSVRAALTRSPASGRGMVCCMEITSSFFGKSMLHWPMAPSAIM